MSNANKKANDFVNDFLEALKESAPPTAGKVTFRNPDNPSDVIVEQSFDAISSPEDLSAVMSVLMSCLGTVVRSTFTGYARAVRDEMLPKVCEELMATGAAVNQGHVDFATNLIQVPLNQLIKEDDKTPLDAIRLPMQVDAAVKNLLSFGLAMYRLGANNSELKFETGLQQALFKAMNNFIKGSGIELNKGTLSETLMTIIRKHVAAAKLLHEADQNEQHPTSD